MHIEANRQKISEHERYGGIIFDEMSIQGGIEIDRKGDIVELSGFTDYGNEGNLCHALRTGTQEKSLGKYVSRTLKKFHAPAEDRAEDLSIYIGALYHVATKTRLVPQGSTSV